MTLNSSRIGASYTNNSITDGKYTLVVSCNDSLNNYGDSGTYNFLVDTVNPNTTFVSAPADSSVQTATHIFMNVSAVDDNNVSTVIDFDDSLVSWWRMDDVSGSTVNDYMGRNDGTIVNAMQTDAGKLGKGFSFDGLEDRINVVNPSFIDDTQGTLVAWISFGDLSGADRAISVSMDGLTNDEFFIELLGNDNNQLRVVLQNVPSPWTANTANNMITDTNYHFIVLTSNSSITRLYLDGVEKTLTDGTGTNAGQWWGSAINANVFTLGGVERTLLYNDLTGKIDDVMVFNRSLSVAEIRALYVNTSSRYLDVNFTSLADGAHTFKAYTQDIAGNVNTTEERTVTVDTTAPTVNITYPVNNSNISKYSIDLNASATDEINTSSRSYYWVINGTLNSTTIDTNTTFNAAEGYYNLTLFVSDGVNNGSDTIFFTLDITNLTITWTIVNPTIGVAGTVFNITANVTDDVQINSVIAYVQKPDENNTATINLSLNDGLYNGSWNSSGRADGTYVIDIVANDEYSNTKEKENGAAIALASYSINISVNSSVGIGGGSGGSGSGGGGSVVIDDTSKTDTWLNITSDVNITLSVAIAKYSDNVKSVDPTTVTELSKYVDIIVDNDANDNISFAEIRINYTDAEVIDANLVESTLRLYKFNDSSAEWDLISPGGVDINANYVWGNVSGFSSFGIFGDEVSAAEEAAAEAEAAATSRGGGCNPKWDCSEWSECSSGLQRRECNRVGTCFMGEKPEEERDCTLEEIPEELLDVDFEIEEPAPKKALPIIEVLIVLFIILFVFVLKKRGKKKKDRKRK